MSPATATHGLQISPDLTLPLGVANKTICIFGKGGSGKSNLEVVLAEELFRAGIPTCIVDPADIHYGIKSARDGKSGGLPFIVFGGLHADHEIYPDMGAVMADVFLDQGLFMVIVTQQWTGGERSRFMTAFANQLYKRGPEKEQRGSARVIILEEAHEYVPLNPGKGEEVMLGAMKRLYTVSRNYWIGFIAATRRPAKMHTDLRNGADITAFFQIVGTQDRKAMVDYLGEVATKEDRDEILPHLAKLPVGTAYFYQPHEEQALQRVMFRHRSTLDTTTTDIPVGHKAIQPVLAKVDLSKLGDALAAAREKAKADDPRELRGRIHELERQLRDSKASAAVAPPRIVEKVVRIEVPVYPDKVREWLVATAADIDRAGKQLVGLAKTLHTGAGMKVTAADRMPREMPGAEELIASDQLKGRTAQPAVGAGAVRSAAPHGTAPAAANPPGSTARSAPSAAPVSDGKVSRPQQRILDALARLDAAHVDQPTRTQVAALAGVSPKSSGFEKNVSTLSTAGLISYPAGGRLQLTAAGMAQTTPGNLPATLEEFQDSLYRLVSGPQAALLRALVEVYPESRSRQQLADLVDVSPLSSGFEKNVSTLSSFGFVRYPEKGHVAADPLVFLEDRR